MWRLISCLHFGGYSDSNNRFSGYKNFGQRSLWLTILSFFKFFVLQEDQVTIEVSIDNRIHSRIIGQRGKSVRKIMENFKVDIRFPRTQENPNVVAITGLEDDCDACKDHLLMLEEEYVSTFK